MVSESVAEELRDKLAKKYHEFHCPCMSKDLSEECTCDLGKFQKLAHEAVEEMAELDLRHRRLVDTASWMVVREEVDGCNSQELDDLKRALEGEG